MAWVSWRRHCSSLCSASAWDISRFFAPTAAALNRLTIPTTRKAVQCHHPHKSSVKSHGSSVVSTADCAALARRVASKKHGTYYHARDVPSAQAGHWRNPEFRLRHVLRQQSSFRAYSCWHGNRDGFPHPGCHYRYDGQAVRSKSDPINRRQHDRSRIPGWWGEKRNARSADDPGYECGDE